jgi:hypothetical protein
VARGMVPACRDHRPRSSTENHRKITPDRPTEASVGTNLRFFDPFPHRTALPTPHRANPALAHYLTTFPGATRKEIGPLEAPHALPGETFGRIVLINVGCISFD